MGTPDKQAPAPPPPAKVWNLVRRYGWTFAPLGPALFVIVTYFGFYAALANCTLFDAGCKTVPTRELLQDRGLCPTAGDANRQAQPPPPAPSPTPVTVRTESADGAPQVSVQVTLPPPPPPAPAATPTEHERRAAVYTGRLSWLFVYAVSMFATLCALVASACVIWASLGGGPGSPPGERRGLPRGAAALAVTALAGVGAGLFVRHFTTEEGMPALVPLVNCLLQQDVKSVLGFVTFGNATSFGLAAVLLLASCATLWPVREPPAAAAEVASRMRYLRVLLYAGMAALVVNVLRLRALFHWALSFLPPPDASRVSKILADITASVTTSEAASYTLLLAAIYVPAVLVLRRRARSLVPPKEGRVVRAGDGKEKVLSEGEWLEANGLNVTGSLKDVLPKLAAILAPLLVGTVGELLKMLGSI